MISHKVSFGVYPGLCVFYSNWSVSVPVGLVLIPTGNKIWWIKYQEMGLCKLGGRRQKNMKTKKLTVMLYLNYIFLTLMLIIVLYPIIYIISCLFQLRNGTDVRKTFPVEATL